MATEQVSSQSPAENFQAYFVPTVSGIAASGYSCRQGLNPHRLFRNRVVVDDSGDTDTLAHKMGHVLINHGHISATLMANLHRPPSLRLNNWQYNRIYSNAP